MQSKRGSEADFTQLAIVTRPRFRDTRAPLVAGQPEVRTYRLRYIDDDEAIGEYSDPIVITARP